MRLLLAPLTVLLLAACGVAGAAASSAPLAGSSPSPVLAPTSDPSPIPTPTPTAPPSTPAPVVPAPASYPVSFGGLAPGTYPVHLHSICNGRQSFHIAYLPNLSVGAQAAGSIDVPAADFGRGWCVVVYANAALTRVATFRSIRTIQSLTPVRRAESLQGGGHAPPALDRLTARLGDERTGGVHQQTRSLDAVAAHRSASTAALTSPKRVALGKSIGRPLARRR